MYHTLETAVKIQLATIGQAFPDTAVTVRTGFELVYAVLGVICFIGVMATRTVLFLVVYYFLMSFFVAALAAGLAIGVYVVCKRIKASCPYVTNTAYCLIFELSRCSRTFPETLSRFVTIRTIHKLSSAEAVKFR